jgi:hypothetical protein
MWKVEDPMPVHHETALVEVEELKWYDILQFIESSRQPHYGLDASRNTTTVSRVPRHQVNDSSDAALRGSLLSVEGSTEEHSFGKRPVDGVLNTVLREKVTSGNDALKILFDAAVEQVQAPVLSGAETDETSQQQSLPSTNLKIDCISKTDVLEIWSGCRFVKMGWFTAREALLYVDL